MTIPNFGGTAFNGQEAPSSRYVLPTFEERTAYGYKRQDPYAKLFEDRIIFLGVQVDDASADDVMAQLLVLESQDPDRDIVMYINSPGGSIYAGLAILDTMQMIRNPISTVAVGVTASFGTVLLAGGTKGQRYALPHATIHIHQPLGGAEGQASDIEIMAREVLRLKAELNEFFANVTGQPLDVIKRDTDRDFYMTAEQAVAYGLIDKVLQPPVKLGSSA